METPIHTISSLFDQLGLDSSTEAIATFIDGHVVPEGVRLSQASFWSESQAMFLQQAKDEDADWVEIVDQLDIMLRR
ncbi:uncharacterized protein DUF2789 [Sinobacterium caligoides]|uniref:Uncharacterized protein DUF2789 n=1 Tax=Sinobacterium caligoides TaxID=933926 RepID=A0A3N2DK95_9GAMM|nr:DUF2789 domain-containing protein [Sinobacterium caligoides]ROS00233.1 uncharacterized protein DUF2789 [Sinobacterium caligoides]